jgi:hypothetical protein
VVRALAIVVLAGCYDPTVRAGAPCAVDSECPGELVCREGSCQADVPPPGPDAPVTPPPDAPRPDACVSFATQLDTCVLPAGNALTLTGGLFTYDTETHELRDPANAVVPVTRVTVAGLGGPIDVLVVDSLTLTEDGTLRVIGPIAFGIVATGTIAIDGLVDASAGGAGARAAASCGAAAGQPPDDHAGGPGGGGGGAFRGAGGDGSTGDVNNDPSAGAPGGTAQPLPVGPLGGCPGGEGADDGPATAGARGVAGGAIYLVGSGPIAIRGTLDAGGGGGGGGQSSAGSGGGGGSGGMILVEAPLVFVDGTLAANGGGGGGGADDVSGNDGDDGSPARRDATRAAGGDGGGAGEGGDGGRGGAGAVLAGETSGDLPDNGGGGGGGGVGYISIASPSSTTVGAVISPALTPWP